MCFCFVLFCLCYTNCHPVGKKVTNFRINVCVVFVVVVVVFLLLLFQAKISTPWRAMFTSGPLWAIIVAHVCNNYTNYTMLTSLPTFMKEVLHFDIKEVWNGIINCLFNFHISLLGQRESDIKEVWKRIKNCLFNDHISLLDRRETDG